MLLSDRVINSDNARMYKINVKKRRFYLKNAVIIKLIGIKNKFNRIPERLISFNPHQYGLFSKVIRHRFSPFNKLRLRLL